jgi:vacuolar-type H+-ATPase subunit C/Vma6
LSSSTDKQLQNNIDDLFCNQQKSTTLSTRKTHYMFSSFDALIINSSSDMQNIKNTINLQNANLQQEKQTQVIVKFKELKKRKTMKSS